MSEKNSKRHIPRTVDEYLKEGCGRCDKWATLDCKVHRWKSILVELRKVVQDAGLTETIKWGQPCYTHHGKNVMLLFALKNHCGLSFMRPTLLDDVDNLLEKSGPNAQEAGIVRLKSLEDLEKKKSQIVALIHQARTKSLHKQSKSKPTPLVYPNVLTHYFSHDPELKIAFEKLTPGRQRGYCIFFEQPKKESTKLKRIQKMREKILSGKGLQE